MTVPREPVPVPAVVTGIAAGRPVTAVWVNELGGVAFQVGSGTDREFVKTAPPAWARLGAPPARGGLVAEAERLAWAAGYVRVPRVLGAGDGWLHTAGLPGRSAVDPHWVADPRTAARAIGSGLRLLHEALPVGECPFDWRVPARLGELSPAGRRGLTDPPPVDRLVVCHGDACAPNTLIDDDGRCCGHVDLGDLGVADRWADLAVAMLSLSWNYSGAWEHELLDAYGVDADATRIDHYQRLWQAGDISSR